MTIASIKVAVMTMSRNNTEPPTASINTNSSDIADVKNGVNLIKQ